MAMLYDHPLVSALVSICLLWALGRGAVLYRERRRLQKLPGLPCSLIFGHLVSMGKVAMKLPRRAHPQMLIAQAIRDYNLPPVFYVDPRPLSIVSLVVTDPDVARQVAESDLPKHPAVVEFVEPFIGSVNMLTSSGPLWKKWRAAFNPGFSTQHLICQIPMFVDCCREFVRLLDDHANTKRVFRMEEEATKITIDVIGKAICGHDFQCLTAGSQFVWWMRAAMSWARDLQSINPFHHYNIMRPVATKYYRFRMSRFIGKILDNRFAAGQSLASGKRKTKTGIDLALELYAKENGERADVSATTMNGEFRQAAIDNLGLLLFAGHDTTASTLCYCYKMLGDNPRALAAARKELDNVFGLDTSAADQLRRSPVLINKLDYTLAVIKEVLRLWSPASTVRAGRKDFFVREPVSGELLPTEGVNIWVQSFSMGRSKQLWGEDADEFKPERFLHGNSANIPADAWRPFERGPRACIGQEFTYLEVKTVLALTLREFDVRCAFDELASLSKDGTFWTKDSSFQSGPQEAFGDPMYQILLATAKPREGMPARVKRRKAF